MPSGLDLISTAGAASATLLVNCESFTVVFAGFLCCFVLGDEEQKNVRHKKRMVGGFVDDPSYQ